MFSTLRKMLIGLFGDGVARLLSGAGMSILTYAALIPLVQGALAAVTSGFSGMGANIAALAYKSGVGVAVTGIGTALLTKAYLDATRPSLSLKKKP